MSYVPSYGYQGAFAEEVTDFELNYNEFELRTYDPQIGRWKGADPYDEFASPYLGMGNDPVNLNDPTGGFTGLLAGATQLGKSAFMAVAGAMVGGGVAAIAGGDENAILKGAAAGATLGLCGSFMGGSTLQVATQTASTFAVGIRTLFFDQYDKPINQIPTAVQATFNLEYGIKLDYINGFLTYAGDVTADNITKTGRDHFIKLLNQKNGPGTFVFGHKMGYFLEGDPLVKAITGGVTVADRITNKFVCFFDLADFNTDLSYKAFQNQSLSSRTFNLGRVIEHEAIGHGVLKYNQEGANLPGETGPGGPEHNVVNFIRRELNLMNRSTYGQLIKPGVWFGKYKLVPFTPADSELYDYTLDIFIKQIDAFVDKVLNRFDPMNYL